MNKIEINEVNKYCTTDIAKWIRQTLKERFKDLKFSVKTENYSGGSSISLSLMKSNKIRFVKRPDEVDEHDIRRIQTARGMTKEEVIEYIKKYFSYNHFDINQYHVESDWTLTDKGKEIWKEIIKIANKYNYDNSDIMTDYFDVNYYLHLHLGKWNKHFIDGSDEK